MRPDLARRLLSEAIGTALLAAAVIGSGIAAARLSPGNVGLQLLESAAVTAAALIAIILALGPVSGAHLNPLVTIADRVLGGTTSMQACSYVVAQFGGAAVGAVVANLMFSEPAVALSTQARSSGALWSGEVVATFGLLVVVLAVARSGRSAAAPFAVGAYIGAAYFFTSSTSFANPAVTVARTLSDTFAGIAPASVGPFVLAQLLGGALALGAVRFLYPIDAAQVEWPVGDNGPGPVGRRGAPAAFQPAVRSGGSVQTQRQPLIEGDPCPTSVRSRGCCSCVSTTPGVPRWRWDGSTTWPVSGLSPRREVLSRPKP